MRPLRYVPCCAALCIVSCGALAQLTWPAVAGAASYEVLVRSTVQATYVRTTAATLTR